MPTAPPESRPATSSDQIQTMALRTIQAAKPHSARYEEDRALWQRFRDACQRDGRMYSETLRILLRTYCQESERGRYR